MKSIKTTITKTYELSIDDIKTILANELECDKKCISIEEIQKAEGDIFDRYATIYTFNGLKVTVKHG